MSTQLILVRHGETEWNVAGRWQGRADQPLNENGRAQAMALARRLATWPVQAVYTSDLKRAVQTARPVAQALGLELRIDERWRERDVGAFSGMTTEEIIATYPELWASREVDPPEGERLPELRERVVAVARWVLARHEGETVVAVTHGGVLYSLLGYVFNRQPYEQLPLTGRGNASITVLQGEGEQWRLATLNDSAHLENGWFR